MSTESIHLAVTTGEQAKAIREKSGGWLLHEMWFIFFTVEVYI